MDTATQPSNFAHITDPVLRGFLECESVENVSPQSFRVMVNDTLRAFAQDKRDPRLTDEVIAAREKAVQGADEACGATRYWEVQNLLREYWSI